MLWGMRILGVFNFLFVGLGLYYAIGMLEIRWGKWPGPPSLLDWSMIMFFYAMSLACLALQVVTGVRIVKGDATALRLFGIVLMFVLLFVIVSTTVDWVLLPPHSASKAVGFWEGGIDPLDPEFFTGFPLVGGIAVLFLLRSGKRRTVRA